MKELHLKAVQAYIDMLTLHIDSKSLSRAFHKETEEFYEKLFETAHEIGERYVDLGGQISTTTLQEKQQEAHNIIVNLKKEIEDYVRNNDVSLGTEDLLGTQAHDLEDMEGSSRVFL